MLKQTVTYFDDQKNSPDFLLARLNQHPAQLQELLGMNLCLVIIILVNVISCTIVALATGWKFGLVAVFGCLPPICAAGGVRMRLENTFERKHRQLYLESSNFAAEYIASMRTVLSLCLGKTLMSEYKVLLEAPLTEGRRMAGASMLLLALVESLELCGMALAFWYGGNLLAKRQYSIAQFFTIFAAVVFGGQATSVLFGFSSSFTKAKVAASQIIAMDVAETLLTTPLPESKMDYGDSGSKDLSLAFTDVCFRYPTRTEAPILQNFNLQVKRGEKIALVGASGCGKSTVLSLLERFYDLGSGSITLNGKPLSQLDIKTTRKELSLVAQDQVLYRGTVRENLCLGLEESIADSEIELACKKAIIWDFISSLPEGLDTSCGNMGVAFSGGQRQRLVIARAFLRKSKILLLDEATSALDVETEKMFSETLAGIGRGVTVVAVAHVGYFWPP